MEASKCMMSNRELCKDAKRCVYELIYLRSVL